jgi:hypothetical protein
LIALIISVAYTIFTMEFYPSQNSMSFEQVQLRSWYQLTSFKHFLLVVLSFAGYLYLNNSDGSSIYLANGFLFLVISSTISAAMYFGLGMNAFRALYYDRNKDLLNTIKLFEYGLSAPITILSYTAMVRMQNNILELLIYFALSLTVILAGSMSTDTLTSKVTLRRIIAAGGGVLASWAFGTLLYYLWQLPWDQNTLTYIILLGFIATRIRYILLFLKPHGAVLSHVWISKKLVTMDLNDRVYLLFGLLALALF